MQTALERAFNDLDPKDLKALTDHALARVKAGEWSGDIARVLIQQVAANHGDDAADIFATRIAREVEKRGTP